MVTTFAHGTSAGDMTASTIRLGYLASGILFGALIAATAVTYFATNKLSTKDYGQDYINSVAAFWLAYILTRPLGASFADGAGKEPRLGGLGRGRRARERRPRRSDPCLGGLPCQDEDRPRAGRVGRVRQDDQACRPIRQKALACRLTLLR